MDWAEAENLRSISSASVDGLATASLEEIRHGLTAIGLSPDEPREIRIIRKGAGPLSGVFNDPQVAAETVLREAGYSSCIGAYVTLNVPGLTVANELSGGTASKDENISRRTRLVLDLDAVRHGATSKEPATEVERKACIERAAEIVAWLVGEGWPEPGVVPTPNGSQCWWKLDIPAEDDALIHRVLKAIDQNFPFDACRCPEDKCSMASAEVDVKMANPSRIARIPGTPGRKGEGTSERPWRCSGLWTGPTMADSKAVENRLLIELASTVSLDTNSWIGQFNTTCDTATSQEINNSLFRLIRWLRACNVPNLAPFKEWLFKGGVGRLCELGACPWEPEHGTSYRPFVAVLPNGKWSAGCHGKRCEEKHWSAFRRLYDTEFVQKERDLDRAAQSWAARYKSTLRG